ncbi:MAG: diguanylate cyclase, partial [Actinomycetota bacterium]
MAILLTFPAIGTLVLGSLVAVDERGAMVAAQELRREAELVEVLASLTIAIEMEADSIVGLQEAAVFGIDVGALEGIFAEGGLVESQEGVDALFEEIAAHDPDQWADRAAVEELLAARPAFIGYRSRLDSETAGFAEVRAEVTEPAERALEAQIQQLDLRFGQLELGSDLSAVAHSMEPARSVLAAAQEERQALAEYLLPLGADGSAEDRYRVLIAANAKYRFALAELDASLPEHRRAELEAIQQEDDWIVYDELRDQALARRITPAVDLSEPLRLLPTGLITFVNGFERVRSLSALERGLSAEFAQGAQELETDANQRLIWVVIAGLGLAVVTATVSVFTIRSITQPLQALLERARRITDGSLDTVRPPGGPSDIDMVHAALDEMTANLQTVTDQAEALSAGRLDDEVFDRQVVGSLGSSVHGSVARLRSMTARLEHEATHDSLTGLPNRAAVIAFLDRSLTGRVEDRQPLAVIMLDLDGFKEANDNMGHLVGDEVLCQVANRLRRRAGEHFVARLGGDEFMIIIAGPDAADLAMPVATAAVTAIGESLSLSCGMLDVSASAGVIETGFGEWLSPSEMLRRADLAMYEAKADSPGEVIRFDQRLHDSLLATTKLAGDLRQALSRDEFRLHLQPIVDAATGHTTGYEALIRWDSPERGPVSPAL